MTTVLEVKGLTRMFEQPVSDTAAPVADAKSEPVVSTVIVWGLMPVQNMNDIDVYVKVCASQAKVIFSNVSFTVPRGRILAIVGPASCGKSQLLRVRC